MINIIKEKYLKLLRYLRNNARVPLTNISKLTGTPISTLHDRLKLSEKNYITKHTSLINFPKLGFNVRANILLSTTDTEKVSAFVLMNMNINSAYNLQGNHNFLLDCVFHDLPAFNEFMVDLSLLPIQTKEVYFINGDIKREAFLA